LRRPMNSSGLNSERSIASLAAIACVLLESIVWGRARKSSDQPRKIAWTYKLQSIVW
jgi:hypothetical protein